MAIAKDRTDELCPSCKKSKLEKNGGGRMVRGPDSLQPNITDSTEFKCPNCGKVFGSDGIAVTSHINIRTNVKFKNE
jgi:predicted RNA-binding Zn-ribbon protein involved in translation (DUF1610 family)